MNISPWFDDLPVVGALSPEDAVIKLRDVGEDELATALEASQDVPQAEVLGIREWFTVPLWMHTAHTFGYLAPTHSANDLLPIHPISTIQADPTLKNSRLIITLGLLRVADYPGRGRHQILLHFTAQNHVPKMTEHVHFNATYRVQEGEHAPIRGYPIFVGLNVGRVGITFRCRTILVKNERDEAFLAFFTDLGKEK